MKKIDIEDVYNDILLLSEADQEDLCLRIQKKLHKNQPEIVAYTVQGKPLTRKQYVHEIDKALKQIEQGKIISDEDMQKEIETW